MEGEKVYCDHDLQLKQKLNQDLIDNNKGEKVFLIVSLVFFVCERIIRSLDAISKLKFFLYHIYDSYKIAETLWP